MEALWSLEDKWKLSTQEAVLLFVCTAFSVIGVCTAVTLKKRARRRQVVGGEDVDGVESMISKKWGDGGCGWGSIKRVLMGTVRWSGASKWDERPLPLLAVQQYEGDVGWQSHNSVSPVWQRPILMGEKCELPRFSGLILYDETGQPLHQPLLSGLNSSVSGDLGLGEGGMRIITTHQEGNFKSVSIGFRPHRGLRSEGNSLCSDLCL